MRCDAETVVHDCIHGPPQVVVCPMWHGPGLLTLGAGLLPGLHPRRKDPLVEPFLASRPAGETALADTEHEIAERAVSVCPAWRLRLQDYHRRLGEWHNMRSLVLRALGRQLDRVDGECRPLNAIDARFRHLLLSNLRSPEGCHFVGTLAVQHQKLDDRPIVIITGLGP